MHLPKPSGKTSGKVFFISSFMFWESSLYSSIMLQKDDMCRSHKLNFVIASVPNRLLVFRITNIFIFFILLLKFMFNQTSPTKFIFLPVTFLAILLDLKVLVSPYFSKSECL